MIAFVTPFIKQIIILIKVFSYQPVVFVDYIDIISELDYGALP